ncbi:MAG: hypothetical protein QNJ36_21625 [Calothrix sp. MO_167.B42]|nr:hypothetical protein [Calothrix sp. MO_167.B42]
MLQHKGLFKLSVVGMTAVVGILVNGISAKAEETILNQSHNKVKVEYRLAQHPKPPTCIKTLVDQLHKHSVIYQALAKRWEGERRLTYRACVRGASPTHCEKILWQPNPYKKRILLTNKQIWMLEQRYDYY